MTDRDHNNFYENLEFAQEGERLIASLLDKKFKDIEILGFNNDNKGDILAKLNGRDVTFEVKEDVRAKDTGNVVIEGSSWGKPSGIYTTKSEFWVMRIHQPTTIINAIYNSCDIRYAIEDNQHFIRKRMLHTDSKNTLYFFKVRDFLRFAIGFL